MSLAAVRVAQCHSCDNLRKFNIRDHCRTSLPHLLGHASYFRVSGWTPFTKSNRTHGNVRYEPQVTSHELAHIVTTRDRTFPVGLVSVED